MCSSGGLGPLLQLLQSSNREVVRKAIWMLMVCAQCPQVAEEACRLRYACTTHCPTPSLSVWPPSAIQLVSQVAACGDHQCAAVAKCALERLFGANLPAKYWVTGALDQTDSTVNTEFYDAGPVSYCRVCPCCVSCRDCVPYSHRQAAVGHLCLSQNSCNSDSIRTSQSLLSTSLRSPPQAPQQPMMRRCTLLRLRMANPAPA